MPGNPLTDPNWARQLADTIERLVGTVREKTTTPLVAVTRGIVFGLLIGIVGLVVLVLLVIAATRAIQILLDLAVPHGRAVYLSYFAVGGIISGLGVFIMRKRFSER